MSLGYRLWNETSEDFDDLSSDEYEAEIAERAILSKRGWDTNPRWNKAKIGSYLSDQARDRGPRDPQFGKMRLIVSEKVNSMATVSQSAEFAKEKAFQLGSGGLHGCTVLTIVSRRAVYMVSLVFPGVFERAQGPRLTCSGSLLGGTLHQ